MPVGLQAAAGKSDMGDMTLQTFIYKSTPTIIGSCCHTISLTGFFFVAT
jgi:type VI protein secretion system component Hcp